ncbi:MAG TPA: hypothetical protein VFW25_11440 [Silvibacterium sp.]|nr:hypothetical protein [Silvibacterium sp.]
MIDDGNHPATKGDLSVLKGDLSALKGDLSALRDELVEAIHDGQTELLKAFYGFTQTVQARFKEQDETEAAIKRRMSTLESRILEIEKRLNLPPSAA